jgi:hypothetical protein
MYLHCRVWIRLFPYNCVPYRIIELNYLNLRNTLWICLGYQSIIDKTTEKRSKMEVQVMKKVVAYDDRTDHFSNLVQMDV